MFTVVKDFWVFFALTTCDQITVETRKKKKKKLKQLPCWAFFRGLISSTQQFEPGFEVDVGVPEAMMKELKTVNKFG